jgi:hypothetical protein
MDMGQSTTGVIWTPSFSPASPAQRDLVRDRSCLVCGSRDMVDPAHIIDRALLGVGQEDERAVVPLCRFPHHAEYDRGALDLEPAVIRLPKKAKPAAAVSKDRTRPVLTDVHLVSDGADGFELIASDSYMAIILPVETEGKPTVGSLPKEALKRAEKLGALKVDEEFAEATDEKTGTGEKVYFTRPTLDPGQSIKLAEIIHKGYERPDDKDPKPFTFCFDLSLLQKYLWGPWGTGKTTLAGAAAFDMLHRRALLWMPASQLLADLSADWNSDRHERALDVLTGDYALCLDDVDKVRNSEYGVENLHQVIDQRVEHERPLLLTANVPIGDLARKYSPAIASRLVGFCRVVHVQGADRRLSEAA